MLAEFPNLPTTFIQALSEGSSLEGETHAENAVLAYLTMKQTLADAGANSRGLEFSRYVHRQSDIGKQLGQYKDAYVRPFYDELDERLSDQDHVLAEILHVKQAIEWFERSKFRQTYHGDTRRGEKLLAWDFYGLLHSRGVQFSIEPASVSGSVDMVLAQGDENPLVADVKIFDPGLSKGSAYIKQGFRQVYRYLEDYNQPVGYLIIFAVSDRQLRVTGYEGGSNIPAIQVHGKSIFVVQIDIFEHLESASHRREPTESLTESELVEAVINADQSS